MPIRDVSAPFAHQILLLYETLAALGGRRFAVRVAGERHLRAALTEHRGLLVATAHVGNWHVGAMTLRELTGLPVHSVAGTQMLRAWTRDLRLGYRKLGLRIHPRTRIVPSLLRHLYNGGIVALHIDGDQHGGTGLASRGILTLSRRTGAPILPAVCAREGPGAFTIRFLPPVIALANARPDPLPSILEELVSDRTGQWCLFRPLRRVA